MSEPQPLENAARYNELVDKRFLHGLTPNEANELEQLGVALDDAMADWYAPTKELLAYLMQEAASEAAEEG